jgi:hypothetical protein
MPAYVPIAAKQNPNKIEKFVTMIYLKKKTILLLDIIHCPDFYLKRTAFRRLDSVSPSSGGTYSVAPSPYLRTPAPTRDRIYKPSTAQTICES